MHRGLKSLFDQVQNIDILTAQVALSFRREDTHTEKQKKRSKKHLYSADITDITSRGAVFQLCNPVFQNFPSNLGQNPSVFPDRPQNFHPGPIWTEPGKLKPSNTSSRVMTF